MVNKKKNSKGLGRGIEALFEDFSEEASENETVSEILLDEIRPNPYQPRKNFDEKGLSELADSIKKSGVFQPIIVRKSTVKGYEIIAGERRFRASKLAEKRTIPAIIREVDEERMMEIAVLENLQREDLNPIEEAEAYNTLMEKLNLTQTQVSDRLGKSRPYIANYLRLLSLPAEVKTMIRQQKLSMGQARTLVSLKDKKRILGLAKKAIAQKMTVRQLETAVAALNGDLRKQVRTKQKKASPFIKESEERLGEKFGTKVAIKNNDKSGKGKIEINYLSNDDLNRILDVLDIRLD
ncbi:ParB/RepB/Spo0J family partition protein [Ligilactobacillus acidipiscis]|jgi:ParB family chromosome partitioning protein|uniref:Chromosome (Plasmid) partitioning protein ParB n=1 Tax=Ligilactobacillus acidipiscis TaxID=89059 RepID=A0A1K1KLZ3_9LACO|nr:ParB/RepB/Spo0J family partition protein [Ligilactobacillus acidipiscis]MCI1924949.1 ParB/RepB/Spo0J family partition protein [Ligilactobacillus acidipiscis]SFV39923.1 Chromosome (plasmid) partitioning protein ParB [Ligilactobacillus acidipiscis]